MQGAAPGAGQGARRVGECLQRLSQGALNSQPTPQLHPCNLGTLPSAGRKSWMTQLPSFLPMGEASHRCWGEAQASAATSSLIT